MHQMVTGGNPVIHITHESHDTIKSLSRLCPLARDDKQASIILGPDQHETF